MEHLDWRYWATMAGMVIWVVVRDAGREPIARLAAKTSASVLLAVGAGEEVAPFLGGSELAAGAVLVGFGVLALDVVSGLVSDREFVRDVIRRRLGGDRD